MAFSSEKVAFWAGVFVMSAAESRSSPGAVFLQDSRKDASPGSDAAAANP